MDKIQVRMAPLRSRTQVFSANRYREQDPGILLVVCVRDVDGQISQYMERFGRKLPGGR
jgi:hypothetical protein